MRWNSHRSLIVLACTFPLWLSGCDRSANEYIPPPPPEVTVQQPERRTITETLDSTGVTRAYESVELRARVRGFIAVKHVDGGQRVNKGDLLFTIDPREYVASAAQAAADLAERESALRLSTLTYERTKDTFSRGAATQQEVDEANAVMEIDRAKVELARAVLDAAELNLEFTEVRSPITGRLGLLTPEVGQLVGTNEATLLATVQNDSRVYATYTIDEQQLLTQRRSYEGRRPGEDGRSEMVVLLGLADESGYPHEGRFHKADSGVDASSGTITIEAIFQNDDGFVLPGMYVRVRALLNEQEAMLVPDVAVGTDQAGRFVLVVNEENAVERRGVRVGALFGRDRRIMEGLEGSEWIVVNGVQRARPGTVVNPVKADASERDEHAATQSPEQEAPGATITGNGE